LKSTLKLVGLEQHEENLTVRFDSRFGDIDGSLPVTPTLEEAYKVVLRS
jgi:hypothetical protein